MVKQYMSPQGCRVTASYEFAEVNIAIDGFTKDDEPDFDLYAERGYSDSENCAEVIHHSRIKTLVTNVIMELDHARDHLSHPVIRDIGAAKRRIQLAVDALRPYLEEPKYYYADDEGWEGPLDECMAYDDEERQSDVVMDYVVWCEREKLKKYPVGAWDADQKDMTPAQSRALVQLIARYEQAEDDSDEVAREFEERQAAYDQTPEARLQAHIEDMSDFHNRERADD